MFFGGFPEILTVDAGGCGKGGSDDLLRDFEGGAGVADFVDDEDVFAVEAGRGLHDLGGIFMVDAVREIEGADAGESIGWKMLEVEILDFGGLDFAGSVLEFAVGIDRQAAEAKPVQAVNAEIGMLGAFPVGEVGPKGVHEPADGASGFVKVDDMVWWRKFMVSGVFRGGAVDGGDELGGVGNVSADGFVDAPVVFGVVTPVLVEITLVRKNRVVGGIDAETVGGSFGDFGVGECDLGEVGERAFEVALLVVGVGLG